MAMADDKDSFLVSAERHGIVMLLSWGLLIPLGAAFSFWLRRMSASSDSSTSNLAFFRIHYMMAGVGAMLALFGWIVACRNFETTWNDTWHGILGTIVMFGAVVNILLYPAMGKPIEQTRMPRQKVVADIHTFSGYTLILLAWVTCYLAARFWTKYLEGLLACLLLVIVANIGLYCKFKESSPASLLMDQTLAADGAIKQQNVGYRKR